MSKFSDIERELNSRASLERELHLKQLQINRLLNITQAINNNLAARDLFKMYNSFLSWEMGVKKMALFVKENGSWVCASHIGVSEKLLEHDISELLPRYMRLKNLSEEEDEFAKEFDVIIPVLHKEEPIGYTFIGGLEEADDMYNRVQFIITITNIVAVAIENKRLFRQQLEQEGFKKEMQLASEMQRLLIPSSLPSNESIAFSSIYKPHFEVGGDYFDLIEIDQHTTAFCIADISGKGLAAALLMSNFQASLRSLLNMPYDISECIRALNQSIYRITEGDRFITFFIAFYNKEKKYIDYINAGHIPPIMCTSKGIELLDKGCTILGSFVELPEVEVGRINLKESALIIAFTDGLTEMTNAKKEYFDDEIFYSFVQEHCHSEVEEFNDALLHRIETFRAGDSYPDDITVLTCKINI